MSIFNNLDRIDSLAQYPSISAMKNILTIPAIFLATASFVSASIVIRPIVNRIKKRQDGQVKKYQQSYYLSRR